jgi:ligand-binding sensor domain-containing protein
MRPVHSYSVAAWLLSLLLVPLSTARGGWQTYTPAHFQGSQILSSLEDSRRRLWLGFEGEPGTAGLACFDGVEWTTVDSVEGRPISEVQALVEDSSGRIWAGGARGLDYAGLVYYDDGRWHRVHEPALRNGDIEHITIDTNGHVWVNVFSRWISRFDGIAWTHFDISYTVLDMVTDSSGNVWVAREGESPLRLPENISFDEAGSTVALLVDNRGVVWAATSNGAQGLMKFDGVSFRTELPGPVTALTQDNLGRIWCATTDSVHVATPEGWKSMEAPALGLNILSFSRSGQLWSSNGADEGVYRFDQSSWRRFTTSDGLNGNKVSLIFNDSAGNVWVGTESSTGLSRFDGELWTTVCPDGFTFCQAPILAMCEASRRRLWVAADSALARRDESGNWENLPEFQGRVVEAIIEKEIGVDRGDIWVATNRGVFSFDGVTWSERYSESVATRSLVETSAGDIWIGTVSLGAVLWSSGAVVDTVSALPSKDVLSLLEDMTGTLWIGTERGLVRLVNGVPVRVVIEDSRIANSYTINALAQDIHGVVWIGSGQGLVRFDGSWREIPLGQAPPGMSRATIFSFAALDSTMWVGTGAGVSRFDGMNWITLSESHGLAGRVIQALEVSRNGMLWLGTESGLSHYEPDRVPPRSVIIGAPSISTSRDLQIAVAPAFSESDISFSASLDGEPWFPLGAGTLFWAGKSLDDGSHELRFQASDEFGNVESPPAVVRFQIDATPPSPIVLTPVPNQAVKDAITIVGTAADTSLGGFLDYQLFLRRPGATAAPLGSVVDTSVVLGVLGGWNTSAYSDGNYDLILTVSDKLGLSGTTIVPVIVDNHEPFVTQTTPALITAAAGGHVYTTDAAAHLYLPPQALERDVTVVIDSIRVATLDLPAAAVPVRAFEISWEDLSLLPFKSGVLELAAPEPAEGGEAAIYWQASGNSGSSWTRLGGTLNDGETSISVAILEPGVYLLALDGGGTPAGSDLGAISLSPRAFSPHGGYGSREIAVSFSLPRAAPVTVRIFNRAGHLVRNVVADLDLGAGENLVRWDGRDGRGSMVASDVYFVTVEALGKTRTASLAVVK